MFVAALILATQQVSIPELGVLVFSKTAGYRHASIEDGKKMFIDLASKNAWMLQITEDSDEFVRDLPRAKVVVFLSTTGDILDDQQQKAFEDWYRKGHGYVGIHAAADTEYDWPWYGELVGAWFKRHPQIQKATVVFEDTRHPITKGMPQTMERTDEWYDYRVDPRGAVYVLAHLDPSSYQGSQMPDDHPIAWCHEFDGGRAFYTGFGHTSESYTETAFVKLITNAVLWAGHRI
ncbi:MAG TPA: ThuA domain-containing protein [Fimbriimonadaceae bacterium]|nr:ThuA domain-containing protein [Fimbriimonadaceae bacterium]